jgi:protein-S-isoprenylcysteine O-methyltransferase Ste14
MALREDFEQTGNWLFRWRSYLPTLLIIPMWIALQDPDYARGLRDNQALWSLICMGISLAGLGVRVLAVGYVPMGTSGRNTKAGQIADLLNTTGMYSIVRHPLYLGNFIIWAGISMYCRVWWVTAIFALLFWLYYERIMFAEEEFLRRKFGETFISWASTTPAFLPKFGGWRSSPLPFSMRSVLRREYPGLFGIITCFYAMEAYRRIVIENCWAFEPVWTSLFSVGLAVFITLRTLKRRTTLLAVAGR